MKKAVLLLIGMALAAMLMSCAANEDSNKQSDSEIDTMLAGELTREITVSYYDTMLYRRFLTEAAELFEKTHPGTKINLRGFSQMPELKYMDLEDGSGVVSNVATDENAEIADYIYRVNAELMSGKGPDILAADVLPYYKYAKSGYFEDLSSYMNANNNFDISEYRGNIFAATKYRSGQYILPIDFAFNFFSFDKSRIEGSAAAVLRNNSKFTYWELTDLIHDQFIDDKSDSRMIDFGRGAVQAFRYLFRYEYTKYVDLDNLTANFEDGSFVQLINNIKQQLENGYFIPNFNSTEDRTRDFVESQRLYYYKFNTDLVLMDIFSPNRNEAHEKTFPIPDADEIAGLWVNSEGNASLLYYQAYGMNANSPNKELAWEFLNFLIGEEMQQSLTLLGFPVNNAAFIERTKEKFSTETADNGRLKVVGEKNINAYNDYMEYLNGFIDELNFYPVTDKIIHEMVTDEVELFFEGVKSAESVAGVLQNKVQLYLSENE